MDGRDVSDSEWKRNGGRCQEDVSAKEGYLLHASFINRNRLPPTTAVGDP